MKLKNIFNKPLILSDQELAYFELLKVELEKENTIKCTPPASPWYIHNSKDGTAFRIGNGSVAFVGPCGTAQFYCPPEVSDKFRKLVEDRLIEEALSFEDFIKTKELLVFDVIPSEQPKLDEKAAY